MSVSFHFMTTSYEGSNPGYDQAQVQMDQLQVDKLGG
jgi:hypothetical protein